MKLHAQSIRIPSGIPISISQLAPSFIPQTTDKINRRPHLISEYLATSSVGSNSLSTIKSFVIAFIALIFTQSALADGLPLKNGRYPGKVVDLKLTDEQKIVIDHYRTCQLEQSTTMNVYTPYIFTLSPSQAAAVKDIAGYSPNHLQVYETVRGFNDAGPHWNIALRYSEDRIEIPVKLLLREKAASAAHHEQGWKSENPCFPNLLPQ
jgi:hypothetical protein